MYGWGANEELLAEALHPYPHDLLIATKIGIAPPTNEHEWTVRGDPAFLRDQVDAGLRRLRVDRLDLLQLHRIDPDIPLADQLGALRELQDAGKVGHIGLSEVTVIELAEARHIIDVASVQNRYNILDREHEAVLAACTDAGTAFLPWRPIHSAAIDASPEIAAIAEEIDATQIQIALAWLLERSPAILPIPGTTSIAHLEQNLDAADVQLSHDQRQHSTRSQPTEATEPQPAPESLINVTVSFRQAVTPDHLPGRLSPRLPTPLWCVGNQANRHRTRRASSPNARTPSRVRHDGKPGGPSPHPDSPIAKLELAEHDGPTANPSSATSRTPDSL